MKHVRRLLAFAIPLALCAAPSFARDESAEGGGLCGERALPDVLHDVARVVDGDTIHVLRDGRLEKLRLLSVDTEERLLGRPELSPTKPETTFGEECALWAQDFFAALAVDGAPARVGLRFPGGVEQRDVYGRLLCHVVLNDGRDFNLMLVELGKSPYFNKYGNSELCHDAFVAAQARAQELQLGIWSPDANRAATQGAPEARRPYPELLRWWNARAKAVDLFRAARAAEPDAVVACDDGDGLEAAFDAQREVRVFGEIDRIFDEKDGSRTVLFRASDKEGALRVRIPKDALAAHAALDLDGTREELRQNYLWVTGTLGSGGSRGGYAFDSRGPESWRPAGPEVAAGGTSEAAAESEAVGTR